MKPFPYGNRKHGKNSILCHSPAALIHAANPRAQQPSRLVAAGGWEPALPPHQPCSTPTPSSVPRGVKAEEEEGKEWSLGKENEAILGGRELPSPTFDRKHHLVRGRMAAAGGALAAAATPNGTRLSPQAYLPPPAAALPGSGRAQRA